MCCDARKSIAIVKLHRDRFAVEVVARNRNNCSTSRGHRKCKTDLKSMHAHVLIAHAEEVVAIEVYLYAHAIRMNCS